MLFSRTPARRIFLFVLGALAWLGACAKAAGNETETKGTTTNALSTISADGATKRSPPGPSASGPAAPQDGIKNQCAEICDRARPLKCRHADECMLNCLAMAQAPNCGDEMSGFFRCLSRQPIGNWECSEEGVATLKEGFCEAEQERIVGCMEAKLKP